MKHAIHLVLGMFLFFIFTSCGKEESLENGRPGEASLWDTSGNCLDITVNGTYVAGTAVNQDNYIDVLVDVFKTGRYTIGTNTVNGLSFSATGQFSAVGRFPVRLMATGTPLAEGVDTFTVALDSTFCDFSVTVQAAGNPPPPTGGLNYFPLTANSWWSYEDPEGISDSLKIVNTGTESLSGKTYNRFVVFDDMNDPLDTILYRLENGIYHKVIDLREEFGPAVTFQNPLIDVPFLKQNISGTANWTTTSFSGTSNGMPLTLRLNYAATTLPTLALGTYTFTDAVQVIEKYEVETVPGTWQEFGLTSTSFYVKDIGLVNVKQSMLADQQIRFWVVN